MKKLILAAALLVCQFAAAQQRIHSTFYYQRATLFEKLTIENDDIVFLGNSITNGGEWSEIFDNPNVKNRGISGDITQGVIDRLEVITKGKPAKIFLLIGINDLAAGFSNELIISNIITIAETIAKESPQTKLYIQSILPVNSHYKAFAKHTAKGKEVVEINAQLQELAKSHNYQYINLYDKFTNGDGELKESLSNDGLHLLGDGYMLWAKTIKNLVLER